MRILIPVDSDEERAIAAAETVTSLPNVAESVQVTLLNVQKKIDSSGDDGGKVTSEEWYNEESYPPSINKAMDVLENVGVITEKRREHADPKEAIIEIAKEIDADRIIMAGRKRSPAGKVLFGSITQYVLLNSDIPVTVITK